MRYSMKGLLNSFKKGFIQGMGIFLGLGSTALLAATISGTINTFSKGDILDADLLNENFASLQTAIENVPTFHSVTDADGKELGILNQIGFTGEGGILNIVTSNGYYLEIWANYGDLRSYYVSYKTSDCSGQAYVSVAPLSIIEVEGLSGYYYVDIDAARTTFSPQSRKQDDGSCNVFSYSEEPYYPVTSNKESVTGFSGFSMPLTME